MLELIGKMNSIDLSMKDKHASYSARSSCLLISFLHILFMCIRIRQSTGCNPAEKKNAEWNLSKQFSEVAKDKNCVAYSISSVVETRDRALRLF